MAHLRIRKFNTKEILSRNLIMTYHRLWWQKDKRFFEGQVSQDLETRETLYAVIANYKQEKRWKILIFC